MSGSHKLSELDRDFTPEDWERIAELESEIDATMPPDESCAVVPMRMLRELEDTPMSELEAALGTDQAGVLAFEECEDSMVSRLRSYITAMGARIKIVAEFPDGDEVILGNFYQKRRWPAPPIKKKVGRISVYQHYETPEPPTTYEQIRWAAKTYCQREDGRRYNAAYRKVNTSDFREALLRRNSVEDIKRLLKFLNRWDGRRRYEDTIPLLLDSVPDAIATLRHLPYSATDENGLNDWDATLVARAMDRLMADKGIGATLASKILAVVNPELFVPWDRPIQKAYFPNHPPDSIGGGARYARFTNDMWEAAKHIRQDALENHDVADPAIHLSQAFGHNPPFTLAKFINDYVWLTVTKKERFPQEIAS